MANDHDELRDLAGAFALGALDEDDRRAFAAHLETCDACRLEAREMARVVEGIGRTLPPIAPPDALRAKVLAAALPAPASMAPQANAPGVQSPSARGPAWPAWLAVAASLAAIATGALAWNYRQGAEQMRADLASMQAQVATMTERVAVLQAAANNAQQTGAVLTAVDLTRIDLSGQAAAPVATGRVFWSTSTGLVFSATNLPPLPPGRVYQLWIIDETPHSAGVISPDSGGRLNVVSPRVALRPKAFAVTIEPDGGRPAPTGAMFLLGST